MRKGQRLIRSLAIAAMAAGLVAGGSLPAAARSRAATQVGSAGHEYVQPDRDLKYRRVPSGMIHVPGVPPGYCDLPSAGCASYLSN